MLSLMIGSHSRYVHIGEVKGLGKEVKADRQFCWLCGGHENCSVLGGISRENINDIYEIIFSRVDGTVNSLVDTSKKTDWALRYLKDQRYEKKFIFLLRDPRALVRRWLLDDHINFRRERLKLIRKTPRFIKMGLAGDKIDVFTGKWLQQNWRILNFLKSRHLDFYTLTYHDLVMKEKEVLGDLMEWLGDKHEPGQEAYWNFTHHGSIKYQYKDSQDKQLDCRWKDFLDPGQQKRIASNPEVQRFLDGCGIMLDGDGLTVPD